MIFENVKYYKKVFPHDENEIQGIKADLDGVHVHIPLDPDNRHYQAIQEWVAEGNKIEDAD